MTIEELEKDINFILSRYNQIDPNIHYPIETYSNDYNDIFIFWENKKKYGNINQQVLTVKIDKLQTLEKKEKDYIKLTNQLTQKLNHKKINTKLNTIIKIITFGITDINKKIEKKKTILQTIKQFKQKNLVKISELGYRLNKFSIINDTNTEINVFQTNKSIPTLS